MSKNNISYLFGCALIGHAIALALLFCLLFVTERVKNVSRETKASQNMEQAAELPDVYAASRSENTQREDERK